MTVRTKVTDARPGGQHTGDASDRLSADKAGSRGGDGGGLSLSRSGGEQSAQEDAMALFGFMKTAMVQGHATGPGAPMGMAGLAAPPDPVPSKNCVAGQPLPRVGRPGSGQSEMDDSDGGPLAAASAGTTTYSPRTTVSRQLLLYVCSICEEEFESRAMKPPIRHTCKGAHAGRHGIGRLIGAASSKSTLGMPAGSVPRTSSVASSIASASGSGGSSGSLSLLKSGPAAGSVAVAVPSSPSQNLVERRLSTRDESLAVRRASSPTPMPIRCPSPSPHTRNLALTASSPRPVLFAGETRRLVSPIGSLSDPPRDRDCDRLDNGPAFSRSRRNSLTQGREHALALVDRFRQHPLLGSGELDDRRKGAVNPFILDKDRYDALTSGKKKRSVSADADLSPNSSKPLNQAPASDLSRCVASSGGQPCQSPRAKRSDYCVWHLNTLSGCKVADAYAVMGDDVEDGDGGGLVIDDDDDHLRNAADQRRRDPVDSARKGRLPRPTEGSGTEMMGLDGSPKAAGAPSGPALRPWRSVSPTRAPRAGDVPVAILAEARLSWAAGGNGMDVDTPREHDANKGLESRGPGPRLEHVVAMDRSGGEAGLGMGGRRSDRDCVTRSPSEASASAASDRSSVASSVADSALSLASSSRHRSPRSRERASIEHMVICDSPRSWEGDEQRSGGGVGLGTSRRGAGYREAVERERDREWERSVHASQGDDSPLWPSTRAGQLADRSWTHAAPKKRKRWSIGHNTVDSVLPSTPSPSVSGAAAVSAVVPPIVSPSSRALHGGRTKLRHMELAHRALSPDRDSDRDRERSNEVPTKGAMSMSELLSIGSWSRGEAAASGSSNASAQGGPRMGCTPNRSPSPCVDGLLSDASVGSAPETAGRSCGSGQTTPLTLVMPDDGLSVDMVTHRSRDRITPRPGSLSRSPSLSDRSISPSVRSSHRDGRSKRASNTPLPADSPRMTSPSLGQLVDKAPHMALPRGMSTGSSSANRIKNLLTSSLSGGAASTAGPVWGGRDSPVVGAAKDSSAVPGAEEGLISTLHILVGELVRRDSERRVEVDVLKDNVRRSEQARQQLENQVYQLAAYVERLKDDLWVAVDAQRRDTEVLKHEFVLMTSLPMHPSWPASMFMDRRGPSLNSLRSSADDPLRSRASGAGGVHGHGHGHGSSSSSSGRTVTGRNASVSDNSSHDSDGSSSSSGSGVLPAASTSSSHSRSSADSSSHSASPSKDSDPFPAYPSPDHCSSSSSSSGSGSGLAAQGLARTPSTSPTHGSTADGDPSERAISNCSLTVCEGEPQVLAGGSNRSPSGAGGSPGVSGSSPGRCGSFPALAGPSRSSPGSYGGFPALAGPSRSSPAFSGGFPALAGPSRSPPRPGGSPARAGGSPALSAEGPGFSSVLGESGSASSDDGGSRRGSESSSKEDAATLEDKSVADGVGDGDGEADRDRDIAGATGAAAG